MAVDYATLKKGGFMRQKQKNNFSLRLRVVGGNLTAKQLAKIAEVSENYGDGYVHLTSRQSVEIPFVKLDDVEAVKDALAEGDVEPGVCGPRVRTITACQGEAICPSGCIDTYALAKELDDRYFAKELPHKFKFGITGCQNNCLKAEENDVGIKGGIKVSWKEDACIGCGVCVKACRQVQSLLRTEKFPLTIQSVTTAADASRLARQMRGTQFTATLFHSADFSATQSTRVKQLFRLLKIKKNLWKSVMPLLTSLQKTQSRANDLSLQSTE